MILDASMLLDLLEKLIETEALELCADPANKNVMFPYVMNDAVECYVCLSGASLQGYMPGQTLDDMSSVELVHQSASQKPGVILRREDGEVITIWYETARLVTHPFQYHLIGHDWRSKAGEEDLRRLVNLICVLHDKRNYLGEDFVNETETHIADLAEFAPVLYYTPIDREILEWYPQTMRGIEAARWLVSAAGDGALMEELEEYARIFLQTCPEGIYDGEYASEKQEKQMKNRIRALAACFGEASHRQVWQVLEQKIEEASRGWPRRSWGSEKDRYLEKRREEVTALYIAEGYQGVYPHLERFDRQHQAVRRITFAEQQPFTVMEAIDFEYKIFSIGRDEKGNCVFKEECAWPAQEV